jgi:hypothetical protein
MFDWLWKRIVNAMMPFIEDYLLDLLEDKDFNESMEKALDAIVDRQIARMQGRIGGLKKGMNAANGEGAYSGFDTGTILQQIAMGMIQKAQNNPTQISNGLNTTNKHVVLRQ